MLESGAGQAQRGVSGGRRRCRPEPRRRAHAAGRAAGFRRHGRTCRSGWLVHAAARARRGLGVEQLLRPVCSACARGARVRCQTLPQCAVHASRPRPARSVLPPPAAGCGRRCRRAGAGRRPGCLASDSARPGTSCRKLTFSSGASRRERRASVRPACARVGGLRWRAAAPGAPRRVCGRLAQQHVVSAIGRLPSSPVSSGPTRARGQQSLVYVGLLRRSTASARRWAASASARARSPARTRRRHRRPRACSDRAWVSACPSSACSAASSPGRFAHLAGDAQPGQLLGRKARRPLPACGCRRDARRAGRGSHKRPDQRRPRSRAGRRCCCQRSSRWLSASDGGAAQRLPAGQSASASARRRWPSDFARRRPRAARRRRRRSPAPWS